MIVQCEKCSKRYNLDDQLLGEQGARLRCPNCGHTFEVLRQRSEAEPRLAPPAIEAAAKKPIGAELRIVQVRSRLGIVYEFSDVTTLANWLTEGKVEFEDEISADGHVWLPIREIADLEDFFATGALPPPAPLSAPKTQVPTDPTAPLPPAAASTAAPQIARPEKGSARNHRFSESRSLGGYLATGIALVVIVWLLDFPAWLGERQVQTQTIAVPALAKTTPSRDAQRALATVCRLLRMGTKDDLHLAQAKIAKLAPDPITGPTILALRVEIEATLALLGERIDRENLKRLGSQLSTAWRHDPRNPLLSRALASYWLVNDNPERAELFLNPGVARHETDALVLKGRILESLGRPSSQVRPLLEDALRRDPTLTKAARTLATYLKTNALGWGEIKQRLKILEQEDQRVRVTIADGTYLPSDAEIRRWLSLEIVQTPERSPPRAATPASTPRTTAPSAAPAAATPPVVALATPSLPTPAQKAEQHFERAQQFMQIEQWNNAIEELLEATRWSPSSARYHETLGWAYHRSGQFDQAGKELDIALIHQPDRAETHNFLSYNLEKQGKLDLSCMELENYIKLSPGAANSPQTEERRRRVCP